jgi:hypothetical protein
MDYVCFEETVDAITAAKKPPIMVIEVKRAEVYNDQEKRAQAMAETVQYALLPDVKSPIACVTDGTRWWYQSPNNGAAVDLTVGGKTLAEDVVLTLEIARGFRDSSNFAQPPPCTRKSTKHEAQSKEQLRLVFEDANDLLDTLGLSSGSPRVSELCRWLFLRLTDYKPSIGGKNQTCWQYLLATGLDDPLSYVNKVLIPKVEQEYGDGGRTFKFARSEIENTPKNTAVVKELMTCLQKISSEDCSDQAGEAFEYLLFSASSIGNDFGEYYRTTVLHPPRCDQGGRIPDIERSETRRHGLRPVLWHWWDADFRVLSSCGEA